MSNNTDDTRLVAIVFLTIGAFVVFPMFFMSFGMMGSGPMMGGMWDGHMWGGGAVPGWLFLVGIVMQLLFLAALVGGGYLIYQGIVGSADSSDQALEELRLAYARGEFTDEEYEQRRNVLERDTESR